MLTAIHASVNSSYNQSVMDNYLENQLNELGENINDAIQESPEVQKILDRIRATGNEVMLAIEASITKDEAPPSLDKTLTENFHRRPLKRIQQRRSKIFAKLEYQT